MIRQKGPDDAVDQRSERCVKPFDLCVMVGVLDNQSVSISSIKGAQSRFHKPPLTPTPLLIKPLTR